MSRKDFEIINVEALQKVFDSMKTRSVASSFILVKILETVRRKILRVLGGNLGFDCDYDKMVDKAFDKAFEKAKE